MRALLEDGSLALDVDADVWPAVEPWLPRIPPAAPAPGATRALIRVERGESSIMAEPAERRAFELRGVDGWVVDGAVRLTTPDGLVGGVVDLAAARATVRVRSTEAILAGGPSALALAAALTASAALLLTRLGRTLVHAAAVVAPDGGAWLLVGGSFSGKSSTCLTLLRAGWDWLADDHVVLATDGGAGVRLEGWPRRFNLDHGYAAGASVGVRSRVDPDEYGPGRWRRSAPLAGLLFPRVEADAPTATTPLPASDALARLLRQSPWLLADPAGAPAVLALLQRAARRPAFALQLGADSYGDATRLSSALPATMTGDVRSPRSSSPGA